MIDEKKRKAKIDKIKLIYKPDDTPIDEEGDRELLDAWLQGELEVMRCFVKAQVSYPVFPSESNSIRRVEWFSSCGKSKINSTIEKEKFSIIVREELADLKHHLEIFAVDTRDFWLVVGNNEELNIHSCED